MKDFDRCTYVNSQLVFRSLENKIKLNKTKQNKKTQWYSASIASL